jgi:hypothetical protein
VNKPQVVRSTHDDQVPAILVILKLRWNNPR